jgi:monoamine oxidase
MSVFSRLFGGHSGGTAVLERPESQAAEVAAAVQILRAARGERRTHVVVVGAGLAGLAAARALVAAGVDTLVLEARERVGGRTYTRPAADGTPIDLGAQWIGPSQDRMAALAAELGCATFPTYDTGRNIQLQGGTRAEYAGAIPTADPLAAADIVEALLELTTMSSQVPLEAPWTAPSAAEWDAQTMASWIAANVTSTGARHLVELTVEALFSAEPGELSLLHCLFYIHSGGGLMNLIGVTGGAQERRFAAGAQSVSIKMAVALGQRIMLGVPVRTIRQSDAGVVVEGDGFAVSAERVIVAIPPALASRIHYAPALPSYRDALTQRVPMGNTFKVHCLYERPFWRAEGLTGQATSDVGALRLTFDNSPEDGSPGILMGFIEGGDRWRTWARRSPEERRAAVLADLVRLYGEQAANPREYIEHSWAEEEYSRGCYAGNFPPGVWTRYGEALRAPSGRIHWAGTETATVWNGYMEGAVQSGERAAAEVREQMQI